MYKRNNKYFQFLMILLMLDVTRVNALTLKESVSNVIDTNPIIKERINNYRATQQDLKIVESEYLPTIDLRSGVGYKNTGDLHNDVSSENYKYYENSLKLTQNIFNGFDTRHKVDYQEARILAAGYHYLEKANDMSFNMVEKYLDVIKNYKLLQNAKDSVDFHRRMYEDIQNLYDAGLNTASSISKVKAGLSLAKTNYIVQKNNTRDAEFHFARIYGKKPIVTDMELPILDVQMPQSIQRATMYAMKNNPSLIVSHYNINGAKALYRKSSSTYYPKIDFEIEQTYNDYSKDNSFDTSDDRFRVGLQLNWNLYRGGADRAAKQKAISKIHQEHQIQQDLQRQVIEGLELSWSAYEIINEQIIQLKEYAKFSESTLESYKEEYNLGKRSLLDFITAQNDVVSSRSQMIKAQHEVLFAQYRLLDAMGLLVTVVMGDQERYEKAVNINSEKISYVLDTLPFSLDSDNDMIVNSIDICDNSHSQDKLMAYGCVKDLVDPNKEISLNIIKKRTLEEGIK